MFYFDTYLNCITPKCVLLEKLEVISKDLKNQNMKIEFRIGRLKIKI